MEWRGLDALDSYRFNCFPDLPPDLCSPSDRIIGEPKEKVEITKRTHLEERRINNPLKLQELYVFQDLLYRTSYEQIQRDANRCVKNY